MKSLLVTAVVLSCFATQSFADQNDQKAMGRDQAPSPAGHDQRRDQGQAPRAQQPPAHQQRPQQPPAQQHQSQPAQHSPQPTQHSQAPAVQRNNTPPAVVPKNEGPKAETAKPLGGQLKPVAPAQQQIKPTPGPHAPAAGQIPPKNNVTPPPARPMVTTQVPPPARPVVRPAVLPPAPPQAVLARNQLFMQQHPQIHNFVDARTVAYRRSYEPQLLALRTRYLAPAYLAPLRVAYRPWVRIGFLAYAYPVRPVVEFYTYFSNPCVSWFYNEYDAGFYEPFYAQYYVRYPELRRGYNHIGMYLPTEEFMAMNVALSDLSIEMQINYRRAMIFLGDRLAERYRAPIARHQVIVNHYVILPSNRGVVVEGFVDNESTQMPFKALVDLNNADNSELFAVGAWKADDVPSVEQSEDLYDMNDQIVDYGGTVDTTVPQS